RRGGVIMRTSAGEVGIQAVSPVSIFGSADQARVARLSTTPAEIITPVIFFGTATFLLVPRIGLPPLVRKGRAEQPRCQGRPASVAPEIHEEVPPTPRRTAHHTGICSRDGQAPRPVTLGSRSGAPRRRDGAKSRHTV